jgi:type III secretion protein Q
MPNAPERWDAPILLALAPERLGREGAALLRRLSRRRVINRAIEAHPTAFVISLSSETAPAGIAATALAGTERIGLHIPLDLLRWINGLVEPELASAAPLEIDRALLLADLAFTSAIEEIGHLLGIEMGPFEPGGAVDVAVRLAVDIHTTGGRRGRALLSLPAALAEPVAALLEAAQPLAADLADLPVPIAFRIGEMAVSLAELEALGPGDVLLHDPISLAALGETWLAPIRLEPGRVTLAGPFRAASCQPESDDMSDYNQRGGATADIDLDQLPVRLVFESGRAELPLGALRSLGVGHVFELGRDAAGPIDIMANGKRIGEGELVRIGDTTGIRIRQLFGHG